MRTHRVKNTTTCNVWCVELSPRYGIDLLSNSLFDLDVNMNKRNGDGIRGLTKFHPQQLGETLGTFTFQGALCWNNSPGKLEVSLKERCKQESLKEKIDCQNQESNQGLSLMASEALPLR